MQETGTGGLQANTTPAASIFPQCLLKAGNRKCDQFQEDEQGPQMLTWQVYGTQCLCSTMAISFRIGRPLKDIYESRGTWQSINVHINKQKSSFKNMSLFLKEIIF